MGVLGAKESTDSLHTHVAKIEAAPKFSEEDDRDKIRMKQDTKKKIRSNIAGATLFGAPAPK